MVVIKQLFKKANKTREKKKKKKKMPQICFKDTRIFVTKVGKNMSDDAL